MKFKVITGYGGTADTSLAMERGETFGIGAMNFSSIQANKPDWLRTKRSTCSRSFHWTGIPSLPDVPTVIELSRKDDEREILRLIVAQSTMARAIYGPPNIPPDRLKLLRTAFDAMMKDRDFLAEAEKLKIELNQPMSGEQNERICESTLCGQAGTCQQGARGDRHQVSASAACRHAIVLPTRGDIANKPRQQTAMLLCRIDIILLLGKLMFPRQRNQ